ncbi:sensor histidine kinase [Microbacterium sp. B2969]|uniref:histidine kinase n=1 Tax=Microbacterium alkaliflavum TaxID=3248839 RepID=A0ABW7QAT1_9MICO
MSTGARTARAPSPRFLGRFAAGGAVVAAVVVCVVALGIVRAGSEFALAHDAVGVVFELIAEVALLAAGLAALIRRRPFAPLVIAIGASWALAEWANPAAPGPVIFTVGLLMHTVWIPFVGWLALAFPSAHPERRTYRQVIVVGLAAAMLPALAAAAVYDSARTGCGSCPENLLLIVGDVGAADAAAWTASLVSMVTCVVFTAVIVVRILVVSPAERLLIGPVCAASAAALALWAVAAASTTFAGPTARGTSDAALEFVSVALIALAVAVSWEMVRIAAARRRSARLVAELSTAAKPGALRGELASITRDDSLDLLFPVADRTVDAGGRTVADPRESRDDRARRVTPAIGRDGAELALLTHRPGLLDDGEFRDAVTRAAGLALEHERLQAELALRVSDLRQSRSRLVASFDDERRRLERDLHDGAQQQVVALLIVLRLAEAEHPDVRKSEAIAEVVAALEELRTLAHGIYPAALAEEGIAAALEQLRESASIPVSLGGLPSGRWPDAVETTAYLVVAETLAGLRAADVDIVCEHETLLVTVTGTRARPDVSDGFAGGVAGLVDRVGAVGGELRVDESLGMLTVRAELPCGS